jgi:hypothetical protein
MRFEQILDTSGKSPAILHHRTTRQAALALRWHALECDFGRKSVATIEVTLARRKTLSGGLEPQA